MNVRMVNATFEDRNERDFDPEANTDRFIAKIPDYAALAVNAFTLCLQRGMPGYEGAVNSAFHADGTLRPSYLPRVERVIRVCDQRGIVVILGPYFQRQSKILRDERAVREGVVNAVKWIQACGFRNVAIELANEYPHEGFAHRVIRDLKGQSSLLRLAKQTAFVPSLDRVIARQTGGSGDWTYEEFLRRASAAVFEAQIVTWNSAVIDIRSPRVSRFFMLRKRSPKGCTPALVYCL